MLLVSSAYKDVEVTEDWFAPEYWANQAIAVSSGGRGSAWFIHTDQGEMVLRRYRRGGMVARVSESLYLFTGPNNVRAVREFRLLEKLREQGLPVPRPVAACYWQAGLFYRAAIIIERIAGSATFGDVWKQAPAETWAEAGKTIRRFHDAGVFHADLNCFNILLQDQNVYLIDFDKGMLCSGHDDNSGWKRKNLSRLYRSLSREAFDIQGKSLLDANWPKLIAGYARV